MEIVKFCLAFAGLTTLYWLATWGVIHLFAKNPRRCLKDNNTPFFAVWVWMVVTFVIYCFNPGPGLLLPDNFHTQIHAIKNIPSNLWDGTDAKITHPEPLSWVRETRFFLKATGLYVLFDSMYFWYAFSDEVGNFFHRVGEIVKKYTEHHEEKEAREHDEKHEHEHSTVGFWKLLSVEFIGEILFELFKIFMKKRA